LAKYDLDAAVCLRDKLSFSPKCLRDSLRLAAMGMNSDKFFVAQAKQWRMTMKHYNCMKCGVQTVEMRWQCPQCHQWGTMSAISEGDGL